MRGVPGARWLLPLVVVGPMAAIGVLTGEPAVVFPEGAALAFGVWTLRVPAWCASWWRLVALPTGCAVAGLGLAVLPMPMWVAGIGAVTVALAGLQWCRSRLGPSLSAAVFPIVFDVHTWVYPVTVLAVCVALVAGGRAGRGERGERPAPPGRWGWPAICLAWAVAVVWFAVCGLVRGVPHAAMAPPLLVSGLEWATGGPGAGRAATGLRRWGVLTGAALIGSAAVRLCPVRWAGALAAVFLALLLLRVTGERHPPAVAIALIPVVLDAPAPWPFTAGIALGAAAVHLLGTALGRLGRARRRLPVTAPVSPTGTG
jgi:HPP family